MGRINKKRGRPNKKRGVRIKKGGVRFWRMGRTNKKWGRLSGKMGRLFGKMGRLCWKMGCVNPVRPCYTTVVRTPAEDSYYIHSHRCVLCAHRVTAPTIRYCAVGSLRPHGPFWSGHTILEIVCAILENGAYNFKTGCADKKTGCVDKKMGRTDKKKGRTV